MIKQKGQTFFKLGAWILMLVGFGHGVAAIYDIFGSGAFSPSSATVLSALKGTSVNLVDWMGGRNTAVFESAWGAYVSFAVGIGFLMGFLGLLFVIISRYPEILAYRNFRLPLVEVIVSALIALFTALFCFWFPTVIVAVVFICFVTALFKMRRRITYAT